MQHINDSREDRNILTICQLYKATQTADVERPTTWRLNAYRIFTSTWYNAIIYLAILTHIGIIFGEPATADALKENGSPPSVLTIEAFCLLIEAFDATLHILIHYKWTSPNWMDAHLSPWVDVSYCVLILLLIIDWILTMTAYVSFELLFPLKPFLLVRNFY